MDNNKDAFEFLATGDHRVIIYSALKQLGMTPSNDQYEDFVQEGWILFTDIFRKYPDNPWDKPKPFLAYARLALYRRFLNKLTRYSATHESAEDQETVDTLVDAQAQTFDVEAAILEASHLNELLEACNPMGQRFIVDTVINNLTVTEMSRKWHVSRQTIYKWRKSAQAALKGTLK